MSLARRGDAEGARKTLPEAWGGFGLREYNFAIAYATLGLTEG